MKTRILLFVLITINAHFVSAQKRPVPENILEAVQFLKSECPDSLKAIIKKTHNDSLVELCYPWEGDFRTIYDWVDSDNKKSRIRKYLEDKGISSNRHQQTVILIAFKENLLGREIEETKILVPYQTIERKWAKEDSARFETDSLRDEYIPRDLEDCFRQIDKFWDDSTKKKVKGMTEDDFSVRTHHGFGTWMRNNWQLWGGSRLSKYFNEMEIYHPDDMSGIILTSYHRYLSGKDIKLQEQIRYYQMYWKVMKEPEKKTYPKGVNNLEFDRKLHYDLEDNTSGIIHIQTNSKSEMTWIYDYHFGWKQLTGDELQRLNSSKPEERELILRRLFNLDD